MRVVLIVCAVAPALLSGVAAAQPQIPATYYGAVSIDGKTPPPDTAVRALIDGVDCTQARPGSGFVIEDGVGAYVLNVMHESQEPGCGREGKTVQFTINGRLAEQTASWRAGPHEVNLNVGAGSPQQLPTPTAAPERTSTPVDSPVATRPAQPTGTPPTDAITLTPPARGETASPAGTPSPTPSAPAPPPAASDGGGIAPGAVIVAALAGLAVIGAGAGLALSRRRT